MDGLIDVELQEDINNQIWLIQDGEPELWFDRFCVYKHVSNQAGAINKAWRLVNRVPAGRASSTWWRYHDLWSWKRRAKAWRASQGELSNVSIKIDQIEGLEEYIFDLLTAVGLSSDFIFDFRDGVLRAITELKRDTATAEIKTYPSDGDDIGAVEVHALGGGDDGNDGGYRDNLAYWREDDPSYVRGFSNFNWYNQNSPSAPLEGHPERYWYNNKYQNPPGFFWECRFREKVFFNKLYVRFYQGSLSYHPRVLRVLALQYHPVRYDLITEIMIDGPGPHILNTYQYSEVVQADIIRLEFEELNSGTFVVLEDFRVYGP